MRSYSTLRLATGCILAAGVPIGAHAQQPIELEGIVISTPSPVLTTGTLVAADVGMPGTLIVVEDAFVSTTVATERDVLSEGGANVSGVLDERPGITSSTFAPGASRPIIRGLDSYRVRVQENGIGSHDVSAISEDHAVPIDPFSADRIEVVRGPATLRYGSGAIGGVVAVENERIPTFIPPTGIAAEIMGGFTSVDDGRDGAFNATVGADGFAFHADAFVRKADDYDTPRGPQANSFIDNRGFGLGLSRIWSDGFIGISVSRVESLYGVPGEEADEGVDPRIDLEQDKVMARGEWRPNAFGVEALRFWFGASDYAHDELARHEEGEEHGDHEEEHEEDHEGEIPLSLGSRFTNREQEGRIEIQHLPVWTVLGEMRGAAGIQVVHRETRGQSFEGESLLEPVETNSLAAFVFEEFDLDATLKMQAAARIEHTRVDGTGWSDFSEGEGHNDHHPWFATTFTGVRDFAPVSASLGVVQDLSLAKARLNAQFTERAPDAAELFSKGMHEATGTFEVGNPFLEKEKAFTLEAGLARASGPLRFDASAFYTRYHGFIYRQLTDVECEPGAHNGHFHCAEAGHEEHDHDEEHHEHLFDLVFFQQRNATFYGFELAAQYDVAPIWNGVWGIEAQYDFVHARFDEGGNVPRIPPHRLGGALVYRDDNWLARAGVLHAFEQNRIGENEIATPGYTNVSAELSYTARLEPGAGLGPSMTIGIKGENLTNEEILNHASFKRREEVLEPGANVRVFGSIKLN